MLPREVAPESDTVTREPRYSVPSQHDLSKSSVTSWVRALGHKMPMNQGLELAGHLWLQDIAWCMS